MHGYEADYKIRAITLLWLEPIINQWLKIHRDYLEETDFEDSLYWYNERANISAFAGAVWKCAGFAIEEFSSEKMKDERKVTGRTDLYFFLGDNDATVEAKVHWLSLIKPEDKNFIEVIAKTRESAFADLQESMAQDPSQHGIALSFIIPYWNKGDNRGDQMRALKNAILNAKSSLSAWFHNQTGNDLVSDKERVFNCVAMIGDLAEK